MNVVKSITLKDGRKLSYSIYGSDKGEPLFYFHGFPGSHCEMIMHDPKVFKDLNVKVIAVNRPGYSDSSSKKKRTLLDWSDDVCELADALSIKRFSILAYSGGGPYALACAYKIPNRLKIVGIVSGMGSIKAPGAKNVLSWDLIRWPGFIQNILFKGMKKMIVNNSKKLLIGMSENLPAVDRKVLSQPRAQKAFVRTIKEAFKNSLRGAKQDAIIYRSDWGFKLKKVNPKIYLWHVEKDKNVKIETAKYTAYKLKKCKAKFYPKEGHISLFYNHSREIFEVFSGN